MGPFPGFWQLQSVPAATIYRPLITSSASTILGNMSDHMDAGAFDSDVSTRSYGWTDRDIFQMAQFLGPSTPYPTHDDEQDDQRLARV